MTLPGDGGGEDSGAGDGGFGLADHAAEAGFGEFDGQVDGAAAVGGEEQAGRAGAGDLGGQGALVETELEGLAELGAQ